MRTCLLALALVAAAFAQQQGYEVHRAASPKASLLAAEDAAWKSAAAISWGPSQYRTQFRALWSDDGLYARFDADDPKAWHTMTKRDEHLWEEEVVEIFLDIDGSGRDYAEIEVNPVNVVCDVRMRRASPDKLSDLSWNFEGLESRTKPYSKGLTAVLFMPWSGFRSLPAGEKAELPPKPGTAWKFNVFRIERPGGPQAPAKDAVFAAWSPTGDPSFHVPAAFRPFTFSQ